jgi:hypothetical protein
MNQSYIFAAHEIYHAFQDDKNIVYDSDDAKERDAMKFENYIRDVFETSDHRKKRSGKVLLGKVSAFDSAGEKVDINSVKFMKEVTVYGIGQDTGQEDEGEKNSIIKQDNTEVNKIFSIDIKRTLEYMTNHGIEKIEIKLE